MSESWDIIYYKRANGSVPANEYFAQCPKNVSLKIKAVLEAVRTAPPPQFSGGGMWEAMKKEMGGYYEVRVNGPNRTHHRLFCLLENGTTEELAKRGLPRPAIAVITGMVKVHRSVFSDDDYKKVRKLGDDHTAQRPRRIAT